MNFGAKITSRKEDDDVIEFVEFLSYCASKKIFITIVSLFALLATLAVGLMIPVEYKASLTLAPIEKNSGNSLVGSSSSVSGLASLAGIKLNSAGIAESTKALEVIKSRPFLESVIKGEILIQQAMAVKGWDQEKEENKYDEDVYNPESSSWLGQDLEPSIFDSYKFIVKNLAVTENIKSGLVAIYFTSNSPKVANEVLRLLIDELDEKYRSEHRRKAEKNIAFLERKIQETQFSELRTMLYGMLEEQMRALMLIESSDDYLFEVVVPSVQPIEPDGPNLVAICLVVFVMIIGAALLFLYIRYAQMHR